MSFTNINVRDPFVDQDLANDGVQDPAGVKALLEQLRTSQAWQDTVAGATVAPTPSPASAQPPTASVAALLSRLQTSSSAPIPVTDPEKVSTPPEPQPPLPAVAQSPSRTQDVKSYTFQQSLPVLAQLSDDPSFISFIAQAGLLAISLQHHVLNSRSASDESRAG